MSKFSDLLTFYRPRDISLNILWPIDEFWEFGLLYGDWYSLNVHATGGLSKNDIRVVSFAYLCICDSTNKLAVLQWQSVSLVVMTVLLRCSIDYV